jgi:putative DNA-invertase from lambdoid prophage Rac
MSSKHQHPLEASLLEANLICVCVYLNRPGQQGLPEEDLRQIDQAGYALDLSRLVVERVPAYRAAAERPLLQRLMRRLACGDEVVVTDLSSLGSSARDVISTIEQFRAAGARLRCLETGPSDLARQPEPVALKALRAICRLDVTARRARSEESIERARSSGIAPGRRPTLSEREKGRILQSLARGTPVTEIAKAFGTSRQTVLRVRDAQDPKRVA